MKTVLQIIAFILLVDVLGFIMWGMSGQVAPDNFHAGIITETVVKAFIS